LELARHWVYALRLGVPKKPTEVFQYLSNQEGFGLEIVRKLRYLSEFSELASRPTSQVDWDYLKTPLLEEKKLFEFFLIKTKEKFFSSP